MIDVGVDIGVRRIALGWPKMGLSQAIDLGKKPGVRHRELFHLAGWMSQVLPMPGMVHLWIEQPYLSNGPGKNQNTTIAMAETVGAIKAAAEWGEVTLVGQSTWKAQVCGNGRADKDEVSLWLLEAHPEVFAKCRSDQDRIDAMCIGLYGMLRSAGLIQAPVKAKRKKRKPKEPKVQRGPDAQPGILDELSDFMAVVDKAAGFGG